MTATALASLLRSAPAVALPGMWKLARGRAITLNPTSDGILRIAHGRVWATVEGPHGFGPSDSGDHVLEVGRSMVLRTGQRVVIEAWNQRGASYFAWDPVPAVATATASRPRVSVADVLQPLADLRLALGLVVKALAQVAKGAGHLAWDLVRGGRRAVPAGCPDGASC